MIGSENTGLGNVLTAGQPPGGRGGGGSGTASDVLARAQFLLGSTVTKCFGTDFDTDNWITFSQAGVTSGAVLSTARRGGVMNLFTGATANNSAKIRPIGGAGLVPNPTADLWYVRSRTAFSTAIDANTYNAISLAGVTPGLFLGLGAIGSESTTEFGYDFYDNAGVQTLHGPLGVALDVAMHVWEMWCDRSRIRIAMDQTELVSLAIPATTSAPGCPGLDVFNGATAANRQLDCDDLIVCTEP